MPNTEIVVPQLADMAAEINHEHELCVTALGEGLGHAKRAGQLLLKAKEVCPHGTWLPWLADNCRFSERTAQAYMRVARQLPALPGDPQRVADLSLREALTRLAEPNELVKAQAFARAHDACVAKSQIILTGCRAALESATTVSELKVIRDMAQSVSDDLVEFKIRAERELGRLLFELKLS